MRWEELVQNGQSPGPRSSHALAAVGDKVYLFGGELQPRVPLPAELYCYDIGSKTWSILDTKGCCPGPRVAGTLAAVGSKLYLYGGRTGVEMTAGAKSDLYVFDTSTNEWQPVAAAEGSPQPPPRSYHAMTACPQDGKLYVFGGCGSSGRLNDLWCFNINSSSWTQLPSNEAVAARGGSVLVASADGQQLFLLGGFNGAELQDCHVFNTDSNSWSCPTCCSGTSNIPAAAAAAAELTQPSDNGSSMVMQMGRSVFGAVLHGSSRSNGSSCSGQHLGCEHNNHVVTFGGEVAPSDKGHAGAGNFTDVLYCLSPIKPHTADAPDAPHSSSSSSQWHKLQVSGSGPGPLGWFATTTTAAGNMIVHGGLGADNERRGDLFMLHMHE